MAVLFALDRAGAADRISDLLSANDIVLLDRYRGVQRRLQRGARGIRAWTARWSPGSVNWSWVDSPLPAPDLQLYLDVPVKRWPSSVPARVRPRTRRVSLDAYERDGGLQARTGELYKQLAATDWVSPWWIVGPETDPAELGAQGSRISL